jgi:hypothetical protein
VLRAFPDRAKRLHFALGGAQPDAVAAWRDAAHRLLDGRSLAPDSPGYLLGCLLLLDGVATAVDLRAAWAALSDVRRDAAGAAAIDWKDGDGRLQRRHLCLVTQLSLALQTGHQAYDVAVGALESELSGCTSAGDAAAGERLGQLIDQVQAALVLMVSGDLAAHVIGRQPLTAVSRSCLVRESTRLALLRVTRADPDESPLADEIPAEPSQALDAIELGLLDAVQAGAHENEVPATLVKSIVAACALDPQELPASSRQRASMLRRLRALAPACEAAGGWVAFLLFVAVTLIKVGTRETRPLAPRTIVAYIPLGFHALAARLATLPIADASTLDWMALVYEPALADPNVPEGQRGKLAACLAAFHDILCSVLGAAPLETRLSAEKTGPVVCAELVWPHEVQRALAWLAASPPEDRLLAQSHAVLALLASGAFRSEDAFHLHVAGVRHDGDALQLAIDPLPSAGEGKTTAARRTVRITDPMAGAVLLAWLERRLTEGALPRDLLFGDPEDGRRAYRRGATIGVLNSVLKAATGEPRVGTHELRHAFLSIAREGMGVHDQRKLDSTSAAAGHEWTSLTLQRYCNLYERPLRSQMDAHIRELVITERAACQLTGLKPGMLRQRWKRARALPNDCIWAALDAAAHATSLKSLDDGYRTGMPSNPLAPTSAPLRFGGVHAVLTDLVDGHPRNVVALRQGVSEEVVREVLLHLHEWHRLRNYPVDSTARPAVPWATAWPRNAQAKWVMVRRALEQASPESLGPVVSSWQSVACEQHIDLSRVEAGFNLLKWLAGTGLLADQLVLCHSREVDPKTAVDVVQGLFDGAAVLRTLAPRRGRPKVYLLVSSTGTAKAEGDVANAALSVAGLHVLMFSAWVWARMTGGPRHE